MKKSCLLFDEIAGW